MLRETLQRDIMDGRPSELEAHSLNKFEKGVKEVSEYTEIDGRPYFRYMAPLITDRECLKCHGHQGYKVGDVRGGVSLSVSMTPYLANQRRQTITYSFSLGLLWLFGFIGSVLASRQLKLRIKERDRAKKELQRSHEQLEWKVEERTAELTKIKYSSKRLRW